MKDDLNVSILSNPIQDRIQVSDNILKLIVDFVSAKSVDPEAVRDALEKTYNHYENQLRIFLIAVAKGKIDRFLRYLKFVDQVEDRLFNSDRLENASTTQLIRTYALAQGYMANDLTYIKQIADMGLEIQKVLGVLNKPFDKELTDSLLGIPHLDASIRSKIRDVLDQCLISIKKDEEELKSDLIDDDIDL